MLSMRPSTSQRLTPPKEEYGHVVEEKQRSLVMSLVEHPRRRKGGNKGGAQGASPNRLGCSSEREWEVPDIADLLGAGGRGARAVLLFLARRPVVAQAQLGPGDGHLVRAGGIHLRREVDDAAVVLHILELVLLGGLHVDHRVLVHMLLQDHSLREESTFT